MFYRHGSLTVQYVTIVEVICDLLRENFSPVNQVYTVYWLRGMESFLKATYYVTFVRESNDIH